MNFIPGHWRAGAVFAIHRDLAAVGNVGAGTDNLITYSLPANVLSLNERGLRITAWGQTANNANAKTVTLNFGSVALITTALTISIAGRWRIVAEVFRTAEDAQDYIAQLVQGATSLVDCEGGTATENDGATISIKCTGAATSDNDIVQDGLMVEVVN